MSQVKLNFKKKVKFNKLLTEFNKIYINFKIILYDLFWKFIKILIKYLSNLLNFTLVLKYILNCELITNIHYFIKSSYHNLKFILYNFISILSKDRIE
jgi:hypothetical protein